MRFPVSVRLFRGIFLFIWLGLLVFTLCRPIQFETDLLAMAGAPETPAEEALLNLARSTSGRLQILVEGSDSLQVRSDIEKLTNWIKTTKAHIQTGLFSSQALKEFLKVYTQHRSGLISTVDRERIEKENWASLQEDALNLWLSPISGPVSLSIDPYGFLLRFWQALPFTDTAFRMENGFLSVHYQDRLFGLVLIDMTHIPFNQWPRFLEQVEHFSVQGRLHISGAPVHAASAAQATAIELNQLSIIGLLFIVFLLLCVFHSIRPAVPAIGSIFVGLMGGWSILSLFFDKPHLVTLIFGTSLIGLSIDYTFHIYLRGKKSIFKPLFMAYLTTILSFSVLLLSSFSVLKQMAVFSIAGLSWVFLFTLLFSSLMRKTYDQSSSVEKWERFVEKAMLKTHLFLKKGGIFVCFVFVLFGIFHVQLEDDVRSLYQAEPELLKRDAFFLEVSGLKSQQAFWIVPGQTIEEILQTEEKVHLTGPSLSAFIPSVQRQKENVKLMRKTYKKLELEKQLGLLDSFKVPETPFLTLQQLPQSLKAMTQTFLGKGKESLFSITPVPLDFKPASGTYVVQPSVSLTNLLNHYRQQTYKLLGIALIALMSLLLAFYQRKAFRLMLAPTLSILSVVAILGLIGIPLGFFHFLSFFLIIGFSVDYSLFCIEKESSGLAVVLSCLTSAVSFGLLAWTTFPLTRSIGLALALGLVFSLFYAVFFFKKELHCNYNKTGSKT